MNPARLASVGNSPILRHPPREFSVRGRRRRHSGEAHLRFHVPDTAARQDATGLTPWFRNRSLACHGQTTPATNITPRRVNLIEPATP